MLESSEFPAGTVLGAYRIVRRIGRGGMGAVYEAEHRELRKRVALKTPYTEAGLSPEGRARFVQEGKTVSRIRHPHVVDITDVGEIDDIAYLVMEYLQGETFAELIKRGGPLPAPLIADILVPVTSALHDAHGLGIVHRDLKPDNIFLTQSVHGNMHPKVLDFGISKVLGESASLRLTNTNTILGTPSYVSPEQLEDAHATTPMSDQYSLGVVIYEAATGKNPFSHHTTLVSMINAVSKGIYRKALAVNPHMDQRLARIALRAMSVSPDDRFPSMAALGAELLPLANPDTRSAWGRLLVPNAAATLALSHVHGTRAPARRSAWWLAAAVLPLLALAAAARRPTESAPREEVSQQALRGPPGRAEAPFPIEPAQLPTAGADPTHPEPAAPPSGGSASTATVKTIGGGAPGSNRPAARASTPLHPRRSNERAPRPEARARPGVVTRAHTAGSELEAEKSAGTAPLAPATKAPSDALRTDNVDPWAPQ